MISRRDLLSTCGAALVVGSGGCLVAAPNAAEGSIPPEEFHIDVPDHLEEIPTHAGEFDWSLMDDDSPQQDSIVIGSRTGIPEAFRPHWVNVYNFADIPLVGVRILDGVADSVVFDQSIAIGDGAYINFILQRPSSYIVTISIPDTDFKRRIRVSCRFFDCNSSTTHFAITDVDELQVTTLSTLAACPHSPC